MTNAKNLLLTGHPGCGKTTLIKRTLACLTVPTQGFYTEEIRAGGRRIGFRLVTLDGASGILAHEKRPGSPRVGRYGVDVATLDRVGTASVRRALEAHAVVVIDEIGPMEFFSAAFREVVWQALDSQMVVLGTIVKRRKPFADAIKARPDVSLVEVTPQNRETLVATLASRIESAYRQATDHPEAGWETGDE